MSHIYADNYYDYIDHGSLRSARIMIPLVQRYQTIRSVLDVGCGRGAWLRGWAESGIADFAGVDGDYIQTDKLPFPASHFTSADLTQPIDLGRKFDLVQCLEVAEHLPERAAEVIVDTLARHGDMILFSAAVPGQGGEFHVNEQPISYWVAKFEKRGYRAWDVVRPALRHEAGVEPWYRFNSLLFSRGHALAGATEADAFPAMGYETPMSWKIRNAMIGLLPSSAVNRLARTKHMAIRAVRSKGG